MCVDAECSGCHYHAGLYQCAEAVCRFSSKKVECGQLIQTACRMEINVVRMYVRVRGACMNECVDACMQWAGHCHFDRQ